MGNGPFPAAREAFPTGNYFFPVMYIVRSLSEILFPSRGQRSRQGTARCRPPRRALKRGKGPVEAIGLHSLPGTGREVEGRRWEGGEWLPRDGERGSRSGFSAPPGLFDN